MDLQLTLDRESDVPLHQQITDALRRAILGTRLPAGARLPSSRHLAATLGVSRNVAVTAYEDLLAEGYLEARHGSGTFVASMLGPGASPRDGQSRTETPRWLGAASPTWRLEPAPDAATIAFRTGVLADVTIPPAVWRRIWNRVGATIPPRDYGQPAGLLALRAAVAAYLGRARAVGCSAEDVIITTGAVQAIDLIARATVVPGNAVAFEEPSSPPPRNAFIARGAQIVPIPVDDDGLIVDRLPVGPAAPPIVVVTPSHQYPLGSRMPVARRMALLDWARRHDSLIVEDDYDSELRYDGPPLPALAGLDGGERVAYVGSFSKIASPALRTGYLVGPLALRERVERLKLVSDYHTPWPVQEALAEFVAGGHLERHIRRMRRTYAAKRNVLLAALSPIAPLARPVGLEAGLHLCLEFLLPLDPDLVVARALARGVAVAPLTPCYHGPPDRHGLILGYGGLSLDQIHHGATILAETIQTLAQP